MSPAAIDAEQTLRSKGSQLPWLPEISYQYFSDSKIVAGDKKGSSLKETLTREEAQHLMAGLAKLEQAKREYRIQKTREEMQRIDAEAQAKAGQGLIRTSLGAVSSLYRNKSSSKLSSPRLIRVPHESSGKKSRSPSPKDDRKKPK